MKTVKKPLITIIALYFMLVIFRIIEYFGIRTDQTIIGEAFIHKIVGIVVLIVVMQQLRLSFQDIGLIKTHVVKELLMGLGFGLAIFVIGYGVELAILGMSGHHFNLQFYVSSYAVDQNIGKGTEAWLFGICIVGNIINVLMEEGVFRGLFPKVLSNRYSFIRAAVIASCLFGLWHAVGPIRSYVDGISSLNGTIMNILMLVITSGLVGYKFMMMSYLRGSIYMGMGDHFVNNTIVNLLHVISNNETDQLMFLRITIAQTVSFFIILILYLRCKGQERQIAK